MRVGVVGINQKLADVCLRERLAQVCRMRFGSNAPFILLSTCNRTEVYFWGSDLATIQSTILAALRQRISVPFEHLLYSYFGSDCFFHLSSVTAGLDSAVVGETEIQGQVKSAYEAARLNRQLSADVHYLFQKSLGIGKRVRAGWDLQGNAVDMESEVERTARSWLGEWTGKRVLVVGASAVGTRVMGKLRASGACDLTLCNRTQERAEQVAMQHGARVLGWSELKQWPRYDVVVFGTKALHPLVWAHQWRPQGHTPVLIDLSVPRNVDPVLARFCPLINIDAIDARVAARRQVCRSDVAVAKQEVGQSVARHVRLWERKRTRFSLEKQIA